MKNDITRISVLILYVKRLVNLAGYTNYLGVTIQLATLLALFSN